MQRKRKKGEKDTKRVDDRRKKEKEKRREQKKTKKKNTKCEDQIQKLKKSFRQRKRREKKKKEGFVLFEFQKKAVKKLRIEANKILKHKNKTQLKNKILELIPEFNKIKKLYGFIREQLKGLEKFYDENKVPNFNNFYDRQDDFENLQTLIVYFSMFNAKWKTRRKIPPDTVSSFYNEMNKQVELMIKESKKIDHVVDVINKILNEDLKVIRNYTRGFNLLTKIQEFITTRRSKIKKWLDNNRRVEELRTHFVTSPVTCDFFSLNMREFGPNISLSTLLKK